MKSLSSSHLTKDTNIYSNKYITSDSITSDKSSPSLNSTLTSNQSGSIKETNKITLSYDPKNKLQILNQFEIIREIGIGTHSKVKLAYDLSLQKPVAIKIMNRKERKRSQFKLEQNLKIKQEINCLKLINKHNNIIQLFEVLDDFQSRKIYLIMEYCPGGEIKWCPDTVNELDANGPPQWSFQRVREMIRDVILGLEYLHNKGIIHRDIKPANLLISNNNIVKISDFSISVIINEHQQSNLNDHTIHSFSSSSSTTNVGPSITSSSSYLSGTTKTNTDIASNMDYLQLIKTEGTPAFFAPELCLGYDAWDKFKLPNNTTLSDNNNNNSTTTTTTSDNYSISTKIDVWALGITTFCLLFGMLPFKSKFELELFDKIINEPAKYPEYVDLMENNVSEITSIQEYELAKDFIEQLLIKNPFNRISVTECKKHPFICFDFNNTIFNDPRTKDSKLLQKLKFLTKQDQDNTVTLNSINNNNNNNNNNNGGTAAAEYRTDVDAFNKGHKLYSFLSPPSSLSIPEDPSLVNIHSRKSLKSLNKKNKNKKNKSKKISDNNNNNNSSNENCSNDDYENTNSNRMVNLPINSSFASLDSFYIENFAMTKLVQEDSDAFNSKFKSASQPVVNETLSSAKSSQTELIIPRRRRKRNSKNKNKNKIGDVYNDNNSMKTNSSIRLNVHDLNSQPSSRVPSSSKPLYSPTLGQNFSSFSSNLTSSSNGSINKDMYKGKMSPNKHLPNDSSFKSSSIDVQLESPIPSFNPISSANKNKGKNKNSFNKNNENNIFNTVCKSSTNKNLNSSTSSNKTSFESDVSSSPPSTQPSYHVTSADASIVSFRNMPQFPDLIPSGPITPLESSSSSLSSVTSSSSISSSISSSSSSYSSSNHDSDSGEELILNIGHSGHMRRQLPQKNQKPESTKVNGLNIMNGNSVISSSSRDIYPDKQSPQLTSNEILDMNKVDEGIINGSFISEEMDSRKLLTDVLNRSSHDDNDKEVRDKEITR